MEIRTVKFKNKKCDDISTDKQQAMQATCSHRVSSYTVQVDLGPLNVLNSVLHFTLLHSSSQKFRH